MTIKWMKRLDSLIGLPICLALTAASAPFARWGRSARGTPRRILLTKAFGMGSLVLVMPLVQGLRQAFPHAEIAFFTFESNRPLLRKYGLIDQFFTISVGGLPRLLLDLTRLLFRIRRFQPDVVIDLEYFSRFTTLLGFLSGAPVRIGYRLPKLWRGRLLTHPVHYNDHRHITEIFAALGHPLAVNLGPGALALPSAKAAPVGVEAARHLLLAAGVRESTRLVGVNPNASELCLERRWPAERFARLAAELSRIPDVRIYWTGAPEEAPYVASVLAQVPEQARRQMINWAGKTCFETLLAILERTTLFITNDSGPLHLAAALDIPTLSFFGPETPTRFGPRGERHCILYRGPYCSPCLNVYTTKSAPCRGRNVCMDAITLDEALRAAHRMLSAHSGFPTST